MIKDVSEAVRRQVYPCVEAVRSDYFFRLVWGKFGVAETCPGSAGSNRFGEFCKFLGLELDLRFGPANLTATEPDFWFGSGSVQAQERFRT
jgi:hypothetical protein